MRTINGRITEMKDAIDPQDAVTLQQAEDLVEAESEYWLAGVQKTGIKRYRTSATVSSGNATFYLTDDGTSEGNAIFNNIYADSIAPQAFSTTDCFLYGTPSVAGDKKSITVAVNRLQSLIAVGLIVVIAAANGTTVRLAVEGD